MKILIGCEFSGVVREAFKKRGHDAWSIDFLPTEIPGQHIVGDLLDYLNDGWDLGIFHPPCTFLAQSGVRWLYNGGKKENGKDLQRWKDMKTGCDFFLALWNADIPRICIENPVMHGHAQKIIGVEFSQSIQPYEYGEPYTKRTCLWLKGLPLLEPTNIIPKNQRKAAVWFESPGPDRQKNRSRTYQGIADAFALYWGDL